MKALTNGHTIFRVNFTEKNPTTITLTVTRLKLGVVRTGADACLEGKEGMTFRARLKAIVFF